MANADETSAHAALVTWLAQFEKRLSCQDFPGVCELFATDACWRDLLALTWNIHTADGTTAIDTMLRATFEELAPVGWVMRPEATIVDGGIEGWFDFSTATGDACGKVVLQGGQATVMFTALQSLHGFEESTGAGGTRETGVTHGAIKNRRSWLDTKTETEETLGYETQPYCVIIGGGQGGLGLAARLKRLNVPTIVVEKNERAGDSWRNRYRTLCLHDPVWYDHMPYLPFPDHWPVFSPKDKLGDWLEMYAKVMELNFWGSTLCTSAEYDDEAERWTVNVERDGELVTLRPTHLVLATGMSGSPLIPDFPGLEEFEGVVCHSSDYRSGAAYAGKRAVVIGSNTSAHDICAELWESGADVTMVQRSPTIVIRSESMSELSWGTLYSEAAVARGVTTERADLTMASTPFRAQPERLVRMNKQFQERDADLYAGLTAAGFLVDFGEDGTGIGGAYPRRGGGYYIDVGASQLLIDGSIGVCSRVGIKKIHSDAVELTNGDVLKADLIVCATGYGPMNEWASKLISPDVARRVGRCWGLGSGAKGDPGPWEGELRNMWKPNQQPGLWFHGGNLMQSRFYSRCVALQLKARLEGVATPVYAIPDVHHLA